MIPYIRLSVKMDFVAECAHFAYIGKKTDFGIRWEVTKMANHYIHVGSVTNAMRGKRLLEEQGIRTYLHRSSHPTDGDGCGYSLLVTDSVERAERILRQRGVRVIRVTDAM